MKLEFTIQAIHEAHKLYTGPDFPKLIREFKLMGMVSNVYNLENGIITYSNDVGECIQEKGIAMNFEIEKIADYDLAIKALRSNQEGETDFAMFCIEIAKAGIYKWVSDLRDMTCSYFDKNDNLIIEEYILSVN
ncbi:MAG: Phage envelope protein [Anaerocolumna sp.]|nr:Phage envelope protein [Anaerocolumna sp.]